MQGQSVSRQKRQRTNRATLGIEGEKALAIAVIQQAVADLSIPAESTPRHAADAAAFLMDRLWQEESPWGKIALEGIEWLTLRKVDRVVSARLAEAAKPHLAAELRQRLSLVVSSE